MNAKYRASPRSLRRLPVLLFLLLVLSVLPIQNVLAALSESARLSNGEVVHSLRQHRAGGNFVTAQILIHAPVELVWEAIRKEKQEDPDLEYSRVVTQLSQDEYVVEERFIVLPVIRAATSRMLMHEIKNHSINYKMVSSDHFVALEGSWILTPTDDGQSTVIELSSHVEIDVPIPQSMVDRATARRLERRLIRIRQLSESNKSRK